MAGWIKLIYLNILYFNFYIVFIKVKQNLLLDYILTRNLFSFFFFKYAFEAKEIAQWWEYLHCKHED